MPRINIGTSLNKSLLWNEALAVDKLPAVVKFCDFPKAIITNIKSTTGSSRSTLALKNYNFGVVAMLLTREWINCFVSYGILEWAKFLPKTIQKYWIYNLTPGCEEVDATHDLLRNLQNIFKFVFLELPW